MYIYSIFLSLFYHCYSSLNQPRRTPSLHSPTNHPPPPQTLNGKRPLSFFPPCLSAKSLSSLPPPLPPHLLSRLLPLDSFDSTIPSSFSLQASLLLSSSCSKSTDGVAPFFHHRRPASLNTISLSTIDWSPLLSRFRSVLLIYFACHCYCHYIILIIFILHPAFKWSRDSRP